MRDQKLAIQKVVPIVRVLIGQEQEVKIEGSKLEIKGLRLKVQSLRVSSIEVVADGKKIEKINWPIELSSRDGIIKVNGKPYRGEIIIYQNGSTLMVINRINVEDYLMGVVPCELRTHEFEALKAQAVASRSFVLWKLNRQEAQNKLYDLTSGVIDQVYGGIESETDITTRSVVDTRGIVCTYNGEVITAQYFSTCGGRTCYGGKPYLSSQICHFCESSPYYKWEKEYSLSDISKKVGERVRDLKICERNKSGRVKLIRILGETANHPMYCEELRNKFGLRSCFFDIRMMGSNVKIIGRGYGHGVGLCQYGAVGMAAKGYNYKSILKYYYKGIKVEKIY